MREGLMRERTSRETTTPTTTSAATAPMARQSTLTRVVEKLERQELLRRDRGGDDQRSVRVALTDAGRRTHALLDAESERIVGTLLDRISKDEQAAVVKGLETLARVVDPNSAAFREVLCQCCPGDQR